MDDGQYIQWLEAQVCSDLNLIEAIYDGTKWFDPIRRLTKDHLDKTKSCDGFTRFMSRHNVEELA